MPKFLLQQQENKKPCHPWNPCQKNKSTKDHSSNNYYL